MAGMGATSKGINYSIIRSDKQSGQGYTPGHKPQLSTYDKGGRVGLKRGGDTRVKTFGGGRTNLLEEVGRIDAEKMNPNRRAEKSRVIGELNRGYNKGGRVGLKKGGDKNTSKEKAISRRYPRKKREKEYRDMGFGDMIDKGEIRFNEYNKGGRVGLKKGGDDKWIQKVDASIKRRGTKGKCTPITKKGCTGKAKALAKTFKKMAKERKA